MSKLYNIFRELSFIRGSLLTLVITWVLMRFGVSIAVPYWSPYLRELGASPFIIGLILSISNIALFISRIPGSYLADIYGRRRIIVVFTFLVAFTQLLYVYAPDWRYILLAVVLEGIFLIYQPALSAMVADLIPEDRRGIGFAVINVLPSISAIFSPLIGAYIVSIYGLETGMRYVFLLITILYLVSAFLRYLFLEETLKNINSGFNLNLKNLFIDSIKSMYRGLHDSPRSLKMVILILVLSSIEDPVFMYYISLYVFDVGGLSEYEWGLLISLFIGLSILLAYPSGWFVDRFGRKNALVNAYLIAIPAFIMFLMAEIPYMLWLSLILLAIGTSLANPAINAFIVDYTPMEYRGRIYGLIGNLNLVSIVASSPLSGYLYELNPRYPFIMVLLLNILIMFVLFRYLDDSVGVN